MRSCVSSEPAPAVRKLLILDANILIRAVLGRRVLALLETHVGKAHFMAPEVAYADASTHLPKILTRQGLPAEAVAHLLDEAFPRLPMLVTPVPHDAYADLEPLTAWKSIWLRPGIRTTPRNSRAGHRRLAQRSRLQPRIERAFRSNRQPVLDRLNSFRS